MNDAPTAKDMIELPGRFMFKIIVKPEHVDQELLLQFTSQHLGRPLKDHKVGTNASSGGKYRSYSLDLYIHEYREIEILYEAYGQHEGIVWVI